MHPWLAPYLQGLVQRANDRRLPHALLITGPQGLGKLSLAEDFAHYLLCNSPETGQACGKCRGCTLLAAGSHPDYQRLAPEEPGKAIKVDQVREFAAFTSLTPQYGGYKVAIIEPAEQLNRNAANSLLKTLEEPAGPTIMLLVTAMPHRLPATIRSRCQLLPVAAPETGVALAWLAEQGLRGSEAETLLALAEGAPLRALALAGQALVDVREEFLSALEQLAQGHSDPVSVAANWHSQAESTPLYWFRQWIMDMIRMKSAAKPPRLANPDTGERLHKLLQTLDLVKLYRLLDGLNEALRLISSSQVNPQLLTEEQLIRWTACQRQ